MDTKKIDSMLSKQANMLYAKGVDANKYHAIILPIVFIKFLTTKVENDWKRYAKNKNLDPRNKNDYNNKFLRKVKIESELIAIDYEYLWSQFLKTPSSEKKAKLDGVFRSLAKYQSSYKGMSIFSFSSSNIKNSDIDKQVQFIENHYDYKESEAIDLFGYIYEYFLEKYNVKQGRGGEFYTPHTIVKLMVNILGTRISESKDEIKIYDPTLGSGGMLTQSLDFFSKKLDDISKVNFFGQEIKDETWNMSRMNFLLRTQAWNFGKKWNDTFSDDEFPNLKFDIILSNPPFNRPFKKDEYQLENDERFQKYGLVYGSKNANFNFFTHIISHLNDDGIAAVLMQPAASQASNNSKEVEIRRKYIENNILDAIISLPQGIFTNTPIGAQIWVFNKSKKHKNILFLDLTNKTIRKNKLEIFNDDVIKLATTLFTEFSRPNNLKIKSPLQFAIVPNEKILEDEFARLNINEHIKIENEQSIVSKKEIASELSKLKIDLEKTFNEIEKTINYLIKE